MIDYAMKRGVNYFDLGFIYHNGSAEYFICKALVSRYNRAEYFLTDKMPLWTVQHPDELTRIFNLQLKRCGVSFFDVYLLHSIDGETLKTAERVCAFDFLLRLREKGYAHQIGFSFHGTTAMLASLLTKYDFIDIVQLSINYEDWFWGMRKPCMK